MLQCNNLAQCQPLITEVSEQHRAQFTHKLEAVASRGILRTDPQNLAKFSTKKLRAVPMSPQQASCDIGNDKVKFVASHSPVITHLGRAVNV